MQVIETLSRIVAGGNLDEREAQSTLDAIFAGSISPVQISALLIALRMKGETPEELAGFARSMRSHLEPVNVQPDGGPLLDTCGTGGGEGAATFNISTVAAFVVAGAGVRVAKHGNRAITSKCGSADLLEALGVQTVLNAVQAAHAIEHVGVGFLFAPAFHPAMRAVQPVRKELRLRTVFNLLGPLTNPAGADAQLVGAPSVETARTMAQALVLLGLPRGLVVHGSGLDEVTTTGETDAFRITSGKIERVTLTPEDFGVGRATIDDLTGGDADCNAAIATAILGGDAGAPRDVVVVNAAAALVACGVAQDWREGAQIAQRSIDSGAARKRLNDYAEFTRASA